MAIITRNAPAGATAVLAANVTELMRANATPHGMKTAARPEELAHSEPHPVYVATLDDLASGKLLAAAKQTGWRYLLAHQDDVVAAKRQSADGHEGCALQKHCKGNEGTHFSTKKQKVDLTDLALP